MSESNKPGTKKLPYTKNPLHDALFALQQIRELALGVIVEKEDPAGEIRLERSRLSGEDQDRLFYLADFIRDRLRVLDCDATRSDR